MQTRAYLFGESEARDNFSEVLRVPVDDDYNNENF